MINLFLTLEFNVYVSENMTEILQANLNDCYSGLRILTAFKDMNQDIYQMSRSAQ